MKKIIDKNCTYLASPNFDLRPKNWQISLLVIHNISLPPKKFNNNNIEDFFTNKLDITKDLYFEQIKDLRVSAHLLIKRSGKIVQFVDLDKRAWHCGNSSFLGQKNCNDFSIGIELEGADDINYEENQYITLVKMTKLIQKFYPKITKDRIVGHADIAPNRKTDPGKSFLWKKYFSLLSQE